MNAPCSITSRQHDALRFVAGYQEAHGGVSPSFDEIAAALGLRAKSSVSMLLTQLEERGWIRRIKRKARAIELVISVTIPRAPDNAPVFRIPAERLGRTE